VTLESPAAPPEFYLVRVDGEPAGELSVDDTSFQLADLPLGRRCVEILGVVATSDTAFYRGCPVECCTACGSAAGYIPALCDGSRALSITVPIFWLSFLFSGGADPPCKVACDCNGDRRLDLSDAVCELGFLFLGTTAPVGWIDERPTCVPLAGDADCETPNPTCG
jgi:hypothetical protein